MASTDSRPRKWMIALVVVWAVCATLSGLQAALLGWGGLGLGITNPGPDAYPADDRVG